MDQDQYPCQQPPWGELSAVNANTGDIAWRVPLGSFEELASEPYKHGGSPNVGGSLATAGGVLFIGATNDSYFRAFDSRTGKELWSSKLDAIANASPMTFQGTSGHQYVVIAAGGPAHLRNVGNSLNGGDSLIAFSLNGGAPAENRITQSQPAPTGQSNTAISSNLPEGDGKQAVVKVCSQCHGVETFSRMRMTGPEWRVIVMDMQQRGSKRHRSRNAGSHCLFRQISKQAVAHQPMRKERRTARCSMPSTPVFRMPTACINVPVLMDVLPENVMGRVRGVKHVRTQRQRESLCNVKIPIHPEISVKKPSTDRLFVPQVPKHPPTACQKWTCRTTEIYSRFAEENRCNQQTGLRMGRSKWR